MPHSASPNPTLPQESLTAFDLGKVYNGSYATFLMAMAGSRVVQIEPNGDERLRLRASVSGAALPFAMLNSNKLSGTLNLKSERGCEILRRLVERADVLRKLRAWPASRQDSEAAYSGWLGIPSEDLKVLQVKGVI